MAMHRSARLECALSGPAIDRAPSASGEIEIRKPPSLDFTAQNVGIADFRRSACIRLIIRNLDDWYRIERRKSLRFRNGADRTVLKDVHFKAIIANGLHITLLSWHPVC